MIIGTLVLARGIHCRNCSEIVTRLSGGLLHYLAELSVPAPKSHNGTWSLELYTDVPYTFLGVTEVTMSGYGNLLLVPFRAKITKILNRDGE